MGHKTFERRWLVRLISAQGNKVRVTICATAEETEVDIRAHIEKYRPGAQIVEITPGKVMEAA